MGAAERRRGADAERAVVAYLRSVGWPDARRYLAGDGRQPGDIDWHPLIVLEVKDCARSAWPTWCRQAVAQAGPGQVPCVVRRTRGVPDVGQWEVRVRGREAGTVLRHPMWGRLASPFVDGWSWRVLTMADLVDLVRAVDEDGAK